jgi:hypothetical protein
MKLCYSTIQALKHSTIALPLTVASARLSVSCSNFSLWSQKADWRAGNESDVLCFLFSRDVVGAAGVFCGMPGKGTERVLVTSGFRSNYE